MYLAKESLSSVETILGSLILRLGAPRIKVTELTLGLKLIDPASAPKLGHWAEKLYQDHAISGVMPETQKLQQFAMSLCGKKGSHTPKWY